MATSSSSYPSLKCDFSRQQNLIHGRGATPTSKNIIFESEPHNFVYSILKSGYIDVSLYGGQICQVFEYL